MSDHKPGRLFLNKGAVPWILAAFLCLLSLSFATKCRAEGEVHLEAGAALVHGEAPALGIAVQHPGPLDTDWLCSLNLVGATSAARNQGALSCMLVDGLGRLDLGVGVALLHHADAYNGSSANFALMLQYRFDEHWVARWRHWSNAGQTEVNKGRDLLMVVYRFR